MIWSDLLFQKVTRHARLRIDGRSKADHTEEMAGILGSFKQDGGDGDEEVKIERGWGVSISWKWNLRLGTRMEEGCERKKKSKVSLQSQNYSLSASIRKKPS